MRLSRLDDTILASSALALLGYWTEKQNNKREKNMHSILKSASKEVVLGHDVPFVIIGERINPTGRKKFQEQLRAGDLSQIEIDVQQQVDGGADVLDVNMGVPLTDEPELLSKAIKLVQSKTDLPICIDSSVIEALAAGLAAGGEVTPVRSAGVYVVERHCWPVMDLRVDWHDAPITELQQLHALYAPQMHDYIQRAVDPTKAPGFK